jgi:hypothetical protein
MTHIQFFKNWMSQEVEYCVLISTGFAMLFPLWNESLTGQPANSKIPEPQFDRVSNRKKIFPFKIRRNAMKRLEILLVMLMVVILWMGIFYFRSVAQYPTRQNDTQNCSVGACSTGYPTINQHDQAACQKIVSTTQCEQKPTKIISVYDETGVYQDLFVVRDGCADGAELHSGCTARSYFTVSGTEGTGSMTVENTGVCSDYTITSCSESTINTQVVKTYTLEDGQTIQRTFYYQEKICVPSCTATPPQSCGENFSIRGPDC